MTVFWVIAGGMIVAALAFVLPPLFRGVIVKSLEFSCDYVFGTWPLNSTT